jgi:hypothetical protein
MRRRVVILAAALAWLISIESAEARLDILVDKATQRMLVIQNGYMRYIWPVSTGRDETATPNGVYTPQRLERNWFSNAYYNSPMPYSIFFHNGYAIHGSYAINQLGGPASHGCVRLHPHHAALLFDLVQQEGPDKTTIEVADEARPNEPSLPGREIAAERGSYPPALYPPVPKIVRYRDPGEMPELSPVQRGNRLIAARANEPSLPPGREIAAERGLDPPTLYPPVPRIVRYRDPGEMPELSPVQRGNRPIAARPNEPSLPPGREIAAERGSYPPALYPPVPRIVRYREPGEMPELAPLQRGNRPMAAIPGEPPLPGREIAAERGVYPPALYPPAPRIVRYREPGEMPELPPVQRSNRPIAAKNPLPPRPPPASPPPSTVGRRLLAEVRPSAPANAPRAPCGAGEASDESSDCRPKPKVAEASPPEPAQRAPSALKLLPASCWSGGASRWKWWGSSQGAPCK